MTATTGITAADGPHTGDGPQVPDGGGGNRPGSGQARFPAGLTLVLACVLLNSDHVDGMPLGSGFTACSVTTQGFSGAGGHPTGTACIRRGSGRNAIFDLAVL